MRRATFPLLLVLSGCDGCEPGAELPDVVEAIPADVAGLWVGSGSGVGFAEVPVLTVNEIGAVVPGAEVTLTSTGTLTAPSATPDAFGFAWAEVSSSVPGAWEVTATGSTFTGTGSGFVTAAPDVHLAFSAWLSAGQDSLVAHAGNGVVGARGNEVWWTPTAGGAAIRVLALADDVVGLRPTHLDVDGVVDLQVWSSEEAVLLRGRGDGGLGYAGGWRPKSGSIQAFTTALLNDDTTPDVLLVTGDADASTIIWLEADGDEWVAQAALDQDYAAYGASAEDLDEDGLAEVTVLTNDGILRRFAWLGPDGGWLAATKSDSSIGVGEGAQLWGGFDYNGDLFDDLLVAGPNRDDEGHAAYVASGGVDFTLVYALTSGVGAPASLGVSAADADGNGDPDVFLSTPGYLYRAEWAAEMSQFMLNSYSAVPDSASIDVADLGGDGLAELLVSRAAAVAFTGTSIADDPDTTDADEGVPWLIETPWSGLFQLGVTGDPWVGDFNGDNLMDVVAFVANGDPAIQAFYGSAENGASSETVHAARSTALLATDVPLDLTLCGTRVWALLTTTTGTVARAYGIDGFGVLTLQGTTETSGGLQIACGAFEGGEAAVTDASGNVMWVSVGKPDVVEAGFGPYGDIVAVDRDGNGVDELAGCAGTCTIATGDFDADGLGDLAWSDGVDTTVSIAGLETALGFGGSVSAGDADGDGVADIVVQNDGVLAAWRGLGGKVGVPWASSIARDTRGRAYVGDLDGNGVPDALWLGDERVADDNADWTGTMLYGEAPDPAAE